MALVRLQKLLADRGVASRRKAEELIENGHVRVNGHPAKIGDKADDRRDVVTVRGRRIDPPPELRYLMLHKPRGYITTLSDESGRKCVADLVQDIGVRVYPVGRLDKDSEGLLLMTNDGAFSNAMMHPTAHVPKRYRVTVRAEVDEAQLLAFEEGIVIDGQKTLPAEASVVSFEKETPDHPARTVLDSKSGGNAPAFGCKKGRTRPRGYGSCIHMHHPLRAHYSINNHNSKSFSKY